MVDPKKPIINTWSTVVGEQPTATNNNSGTDSPAATTANDNTSTAAKTPTTTVPENTSTAGTSTGGNTKKTTSISTTVPIEFKGSTNQDVIDYLERKIAQHKPLSDEDLAKIRRKQKIEGIISGVSDAAQAISNLIFTNQYAPNMYNPKEGMSAKAQARFDKEKAEREAEDERYFNYAMQLGKLKGEDQERGLKVWQTEQALAREDRAYDAGRQDRADDVAFRDKDFDERVRQWQAGFDRDEEWHKEEVQRWERQFQESIRQFNVSSSLERQRLNMEAQRLAHSLKEGQMTFNLGSGYGNVTLSIDKINAQTVSRIFSTLPQNVRSQVQGDPIVKNGRVVGYGQPSTEAMLIAIGANVESSLATQNAIKQVAGLETGKKSGGNKMPGVK